MAVLSDSIEQFIKSLMDEYDEMIEIQRNELADYFSCAPSQINYVLATRFSPEKGYLIESRRGGGGYIKLVKTNPDKSEHILSLISEKLKSGSISKKDAHELISGLREMGLIEEKQEKLMMAAISDKAIHIPSNIKDNLRASILKEMLLSILGED